MLARAGATAAVVSSCGSSPWSVGPGTSTILVEVVVGEDGIRSFEAGSNRGRNTRELRRLAPDDRTPPERLGIRCRSAISTHAVNVEADGVTLRDACDSVLPNRALGIRCRRQESPLTSASLRQSLSHIGEPSQAGALTIPGGFHSAPGTLRRTMRAMRPPKIEGWMPLFQSTFENLQWTEECQGLTTDGENWFISSNNGDFRGVHKRSLDFGTHLRNVRMLPSAGVHPGDLDFDAARHRIFVPVESDPRVWVLDSDLDTVEVADLGGGPGLSPQGGSMPWCAVNPWNGLLYSSAFDNVDRVHAYDPDDNFKHVGSLRLGGAPLFRVQGGCFSKEGRLYLTSDHSEDLRAYSSLNGYFYGRVGVPYTKGGVDQEEMEGVAIAHLLHADASTWVHVVILDNDLSPDDVFIKHFVVPNPDDI